MRQLRCRLHSLHPQPEAETRGAKCRAPFAFATVAIGQSTASAEVSSPFAEALAAGDTAAIRKAAPKADLHSHLYFAAPVSRTSNAGSATPLPVRRRGWMDSTACGPTRASQSTPIMDNWTAFAFAAGAALRHAAQ